MVSRYCLASGGSARASSHASIFSASTRASAFNSSNRFPLAVAAFILTIPRSPFQKIPCV
nr:MAG TPA: hypothetical protein [Caudoviricetes sp.]